MNAITAGRELTKSRAAITRVVVTIIAGFMARQPYRDIAANQAIAATCLPRFEAASIFGGAWSVAESRRLTVVVALAGWRVDTDRRDGFSATECHQMQGC